MDQGNKLAYLAIGLGVTLLIVVLAFLAVGKKEVVSPLPQEGIRVIFESPKP